MRIKKLYSTNNFASFSSTSSAEDVNAAASKSVRTVPLPKPGRKFFTSNKPENKSGVKDGKVTAAKDNFCDSVRKGRPTSTPVKASLLRLSVSKEKVPPQAPTSAKEKNRSPTRQVSQKEPKVVKAATRKDQCSTGIRNSPPLMPPTLSMHIISTTVEETPPSSPSPPSRVTTAVAARKVTGQPPSAPVLPPKKAASVLSSSSESDAATPTKRGPDERDRCQVNSARQFCFCGPILRASETIIVEEIKKMVRTEFRELCRGRAEAIASYIENKFEDLKQMKH